MRPEQERVRNLLIDTVTLLCKNSVQFSDVLHVEGLLGVSVDKKDVFFVHISKEFTNSPSEGATVTEQRDRVVEADPEPTETQDSQTLRAQKQEAITVKTERLEVEDECLIVEDPNIKLEGSVSPAQIVAGQRRANKRTSHSSLHYDGSSSFHGGAYSVEGGSNNSGYAQSGEPYAKRQLTGASDDYGDQDEGNYTAHEVNDDNGGGGGSGGGSGQGWPSLAAISSNFDTNQQSFQQDSDNSQMSLTDGTQPGCSSWSAGPSDSVRNFRSPGGGIVDMVQRYGYECEVCAKKFSKKHDFIRHRRVHTGERPFRCSLCNTQFSLKANLKQHLLRVHKFTEQDLMPIVHYAGKRHRDPQIAPGTALRHECPVCGKGFYFECYLNRHMTSHLNERPYTCSTCKRRFKRKDHLQRHNDKTCVDHNGLSVGLPEDMAINESTDLFIQTDYNPEILASKNGQQR